MRNEVATRISQFADSTVGAPDTVESSRAIAAAIEQRALFDVHVVHGHRNVHAARELDVLALRLRGQAAAAAEAEAAHAAAAASDAANARAHAEAARWGHVLEYAYNHFSSPPTAGSQLYPQVPIQNYAQYGWELIKGFHTQYTPAGFQTQLDASTYYSGDSTNPATCGSFVGALAVFRDGRVEVVW